MQETVIVVLGAKLLPGGAAGPALARRVAHGAALFAQGGVARVIVTGGPEGAPVTEADVMAGLLVAAGVPEGAVVRENRAGDTWGNARFCARLLRGTEPVVVVTERYHLPRALLAFRLAGVRARGSGAVWRGYPDRRARGIAVMREMVAIPVLLARALAWRLGGRR